MSPQMPGMGTHCIMLVTGAPGLAYTSLGLSQLHLVSIAGSPVWGSPVSLSPPKAVTKAKHGYLPRVPVCRALPLCLGPEMPFCRIVVICTLFPPTLRLFLATLDTVQRPQAGSGRSSRAGVPPLFIYVAKQLS